MIPRKSKARQMSMQDVYASQQSLSVVLYARAQGCSVGVSTRVDSWDDYVTNYDGLLRWT